MIRWTNSGSTDARVERELRAMFVLKKYGQSTVTPTPVPVSSPASVSLSATTAALVTLYGPISGPHANAAIDATLSTCPLPRFFIAGTNRWQPYVGPHWLMPTIHAQSSRLLEQDGA